MYVESQYFFSNTSKSRETKNLDFLKFLEKLPKTVAELPSRQVCIANSKGRFKEYKLPIDW